MRKLILLSLILISCTKPSNTLPSTPSATTEQVEITMTAVIHGNDSVLYILDCDKLRSGYLTKANPTFTSSFTATKQSTPKPYGGSALECPNGDGPDSVSFKIIVNNITVASQNVDALEASEWINY